MKPKPMIRIFSVAALLVAPLGAVAQQAPPVTFYAGPTAEDLAERSRLAFDSVRSLGADLDRIRPFDAELSAADRAFIGSECATCEDDGGGGAPLLAAGVTKPSGEFLDFEAVKNLDLGTGSRALSLGTARQHDDGMITWTMAAESSKATGIRFHLTDVLLPKGAEIVAFSRGGQGHGPYTAADITRSGAIWTAEIHAPVAYLEVRFPEDAEPPAFRLEKVGVIVDPAFMKGGTTPTLNETSCSYPSCYEEYACVDPADFPNLEQMSNATGRYLFEKGGSFYLCSGGLVNDGRGLENYLFITAAHCFSTQASAESMSIRFQYRSENCNTGCLGTSAGILNSSGADLLVTNSDTDYTLVGLKTAPPAGSVFLGFDAQTNYAGTAGIDLYRVHHPGGYMQHVTSYWTNTENTTCTARPRSRYIQMTRNIGWTAGGSSDSLIVNNQAQAVGQFYGGCGAAQQGSCDPNRIHVDGQFRLSYQLSTDYFTDPNAETEYIWNLASGDWDDPSSWTPARTTPAANDILVFDGDSPSGSMITVSNISSTTANKLRILDGAQVTFLDGQSPTTTINLVDAGQAFFLGVGSSLELQNSSAGTIRILLAASATGVVGGDLIFAAQDDAANPRLVSTTPGGLIFTGGGTAAVAPGAGVTTDDLGVARGGFGSASDNAVANGVVFFAGSTWYQGGRKDGTRTGAQSAGPHGLSSPDQIVDFRDGSEYVILRGGFASPRNYPTVVFRDDIGQRDIVSGSVIDGDLIFGEPGGNATGIGFMNLNGTLDPTLTITGDLIIPASAGTTYLESQATPSGLSRVYIGGDVQVGDPAKFPPGLNGRRWHFNGSTPQTADFGGDETLHRLVIDNTAGVTFANNITLTGGLELASGFLDMGSNALNLGTNFVSTPINGWIQGRLGRILDPTSTGIRTYQVGTPNGLGTFRITPQTTGGTAGELLISSSGTAYTEGTVPGTPVLRWWRAEPGNGSPLDTSGATFEIGLDWTADDIPPGLDPATLAVARYTASGGTKRLINAVDIWEGTDVTIDTGLQRATVSSVDSPVGDWILYQPATGMNEEWMLF